MESTNKLKLVIDANMYNASGIGTYIKNIVPFLIDKFNITLLINSDDIKKFVFHKNITIIQCNSKIYSIKEQLELFKKIPPCDLFWSPHYNIPLLPIKAKKRMVTIHDVFHLAYYEDLSFKQKIYAKLVINQAVKLSNMVITDSIFSKNEIKKYTNFEINEIVGCSIDKQKFKLINIKNILLNVKQKYNLPDDFLLFIGNVKPHKNLQNLLLAIKDIDENLVIVGKKDGFITGDNGIYDLIVKYNLEDKIFFTGYVEDNDIPAIYNLAKLFVFPSLYEGFGIPPLEAQACGCPVVCSNAASLPEVGGEDSVIYCDPYDINDIKEKIELVLNDENLQNELIEKGFNNIKRFSWEESARKIIEVIEGIK